MIRFCMIFGIAAAVIVTVVAPSFAAGDKNADGDLSAQRRPRVTIYPRSRALPPTATRNCRAVLVKEYRVSGPVIVPRETCFWQ
jgi:hypothetical protein